MTTLQSSSCWRSVASNLIFILSDFRAKQIPPAYNPELFLFRGLVSSGLRDRPVDVGPDPHFRPDGRPSANVGG